LKTTKKRLKEEKNQKQVKNKRKIEDINKTFEIEREKYAEQLDLMDKEREEIKRAIRDTDEKINELMLMQKIKMKLKYGEKFDHLMKEHLKDSSNTPKESN